MSNRAPLKSDARIGIIRPDGIGDQILCLPTATALRRLMPKAHITFVSSAYAAPLFQHHPDIDAVLPMTRQETTRELAALFRGRFDAVVFLRPFRRPIMAAWLARIPLRVATASRWYSVFANRRIRQHRSDFSRHERDYNLEMLTGLGLDPEAHRGTQPSLYVTDAERRWAAEQLRGLPRPIVAIHPGGFTARRWRAEHYAELAATLADAGSGIVITGSDAEGREFRAASGLRHHDAIRDLAGRLGVRELMAVIASSDAVVCGATGPAHIASALDVPTVTVYDPRRMNLPIRWGPLGRGVVLTPAVPTCEKCIHEACPYWDCLDRITVPEVAHHVRDLARGPAQSVLLKV
ncbi:MAG TPA: glycosyltransferase family 9 protein [Nitrospirales bacterium]|nr:glycosyltransferase family 9 protein [Nitrospirales bacterium]